jgi:hypothetical protein
MKSKKSEPSCIVVQDNSEKKLRSAVSLFSFYQFRQCGGNNIPGYFVVSTAPINLEDNNKELEEYDQAKDLKSFKKIDKERFIADSEAGLEAIVNDIQQKNEKAGTDNEVELVVAIHGYNTAGCNVMDWYQKIWRFANNEEEKLGKDFVFLGYRWPSENFTKNCISNLRHAFSAMPLVLQIILVIGLVLFSIIAFLLEKFFIQSSVLFLGTSLATFLISLPLTLIIIRLSVYLRDSYRATNFGIPDLVELIRLLDDRLLAKAVEQFKSDSRNSQAFDELEGIIAIINKFCQESSHLSLDKHILMADILKDYLKREGYWTGGVICSIDKLLSALGIDEEKIRKQISQKPEYINEINKKLENISEIVREGFNRVSEQKDKFGWIENDKKRIRLTFLCHSMGAFVTTGAVRVLSDVFDSGSIGSLDQNKPRKLPTSNIGHVFSLGRLILVSPDIPQWAITSSRANFLQASLRRFEEAYLFSNKGDMVLLVASTSANYSSLPTITGSRSFRLGNLAIKKPEGDSSNEACKYGIINLQELKNSYENKPLQDILKDNKPLKDLLNYLEVGGYCLKAINTKTPSNFTNQESEETIANLFTYFDCTDYWDCKYYYDQKTQTERLTKKPDKVLSYSFDHSWPFFTFITQVCLTIRGLIFKHIDVHGGYFNGKYSRALIYHLAFGGFKDLRKLKSIDVLNKELQDKTIRVALSPERYLVDIKMCDAKQARKKVLNY